MKKFAVAHASLFDNEMHIEFVEAQTALDAARKVFTTLCGEELANAQTTVEDLCEQAFNCDMLFGVEEIKD